MGNSVAFVMPAKAGIQFKKKPGHFRGQRSWIPASAGMTSFSYYDRVSREEGFIFILFVFILSRERERGGVRSEAVFRAMVEFFSN